MSLSPITGHVQLM